MLHRTSLLLLTALASSTAAQTITGVVVEGDSVSGIGNVNSIDGMFVNDAGDWLVEADTTHADTDADGVVLLSGALFLREGDALAAPLGTSVGSFDSVQMNDAGDVRWNLFLDGATSGTDSGFFHGTTLLFQEGDAPAIPGLSAGSAFQGFFESKTDDSGTSLLLATIDDPAIPTSVDQVLVQVSGDTQGTLSFTVVAKEGDTLPGQTETVEDFSTNPHSFAYSENGIAMYFADLTGPGATDGAVYMGPTLIAQEGSPSPVAGRNWSSLSSAKMDVNANASYVLTGTLDGDSSTNAVIVKDGAKFRQEGDTLPAIAPHVFTSFGSGPVWISKLGDVMWYGDWDDPNTAFDTGLFLNDELVIQEGVTQVAGLTVDTVRGIQDGYFLADDGRWAIVELELVGGVQVAALIDFGLGTVSPMSDCTGPLATLTWTGGEPKVATTFDLTLDNPQGAQVFPFLGIATQPIAGFPPCGLVLPGVGEVLIDILPPNPLAVVGATATGGGPTVFTIPIPNDAAFGGTTFHAQGVYLDLLAFTSESIRLSGGVTVLVGP